MRYTVSTLLMLAACTTDPAGLTPLCVASGDLIACDVSEDHGGALDVCADLDAALFEPTSREEMIEAAELGAERFAGHAWWIHAEQYQCSIQDITGAWTPAECGERWPVMCRG